MRYLLLLFTVITLFACGGNKATTAKMFCDTTCLTDTIKFKKEDHKLKPYLYISTKNCLPDSVIWSYSGLGTNRKYPFETFGLKKFHLNKNYMTTYFNDTSYIWVLFNNCENGRGYLAKIFFDKSKKTIRNGRALNKFDPKYVVSEGLAAYTDKGNIFVEEMATGKTAEMTFGKCLEEIDDDYLHDYIDSVNITPTRIWAKVKIDKKWQTLERNVELQMPKASK
jgi:hypothetical protein